MFWYIAHVKAGMTEKLMNALNRHENIDAFIPKKERWSRGGKGGRGYSIMELYPDYVFIKSKFDKDEFNKEFKQYFESMNGLVEVLDYDDVYALSRDEQELLEKLFNGGDVIKHTVGKNIDSGFLPVEGPLKGLEDRIIKVNRHDRYALLDCSIFTGHLMVGIDVMK